MEIYGTLGPSCGREDVLCAMFRAGMTGIRLNLSHTTLAESRDLLAAYRAAAARAGVSRPDLLIDMQGPELRIGSLMAPMSLAEGDEVLLAGDEAAFADSKMQVIPVPPAVCRALQIGQEVLLDDGKLLLQITGAEFRTGAESRPGIESRTGEESSSGAGSSSAGYVTAAKAKVLRGGRLSSRKSLAIPGGPRIQAPAITDADRRNLAEAKAAGVTGVMQPFVRGPEDLRELRAALREAGAGDLRIFAKIENMDGVRHLEQLLPEADVIVIARGDLGNSVPLPKLPGVQKDIAAVCQMHGKPFLVVTQMLAGMEQSPVPTRAEVSDIFNAVLDGADALMITGESAVGKYPAEAVRVLAETACEALKWKERLNHED